MDSIIRSHSHDKGHTNSPQWTVIIFAGGLLLVGMLIAFVSFIAQPDAVGMNAPQKYPPIYPPDWMFWAVWIVIYPCWGVATWLVWRRRDEVDLRIFWRFFAVLFVILMAFLPISALTYGNPIVLTTMDASAVIVLPFAAWLYGRHMRSALWWLLPMFIWGPITLFFKVWLTLVNR